MLQFPYFIIFMLNFLHLDIKNKSDNNSFF